MSSAWKAQRGIRCSFKIAELFSSAYLIWAIYHIGPQWVLLVAALIVPIYGFYAVIVRTVDPHRTAHSIPYIRWKAIAKAKNWQKADIAVSLSMSVVSVGFSGILFFGYFRIRTATPYFLHGAVASMFLSFLYVLDALTTVCQLKSASVDFDRPKSFSTAKSTDFGGTYFSAPKPDVEIRRASVDTLRFEQSRDRSWFDPEPIRRPMVIQRTEITDNSKRFHSDEELPPPPNEYKIGSRPYARRVIVPFENHRNSETSDEDNRIERRTTEEPIAAPMIIQYKTESIHSPPLKARMVLVEETEEEKRQSDGSASTVRLDDIPLNRLSVPQPIRSFDRSVSSHYNR